MRDQPQVPAGGEFGAAQGERSGGVTWQVRPLFTGDGWISPVRRPEQSALGSAVPRAREPVLRLERRPTDRRLQADFLRQDGSFKRAQHATLRLFPVPDSRIMFQERGSSSARSVPSVTVVSVAECGMT